MPRAGDMCPSTNQMVQGEGENRNREGDKTICPFFGGEKAPDPKRYENMIFNILHKQVNVFQVLPGGRSLWSESLGHVIVGRHKAYEGTNGWLKAAVQMSSGAQTHGLMERQ